MPYDNWAQAAKFHILEKEGKISHKVVAEFDAASKGLHLPAGPKHHHTAAHKGAYARKHAEPRGDRSHQTTAHRAVHR